VSEVNDENQLDEDEEKASNHAEVHPHLAECPVRDPEGANHSPDDEQVFEAPEPVLDSGSAIVNQNAGITVMKLYLAEIRIFVHHYVPYTLHMLLFRYPWYRYVYWVTCTKFP
jgi:hypothetical protein